MLGSALAIAEEHSHRKAATGDSEMADRELIAAIRGTQPHLYSACVLCTTLHDVLCTPRRGVRSR
jgi:hypothetical protein